MYQCAASNEAATIVADAELMVLNVPPRAPYNLSANSGKNSVTLTWIPGYVRPKMDYSIWYIIKQLVTNKYSLISTQFNEFFYSLVVVNEKPNFDTPFNMMIILTILLLSSNVEE